MKEAAAAAKRNIDGTYHYNGFTCYLDATGSDAGLWRAIDSHHSFHALTFRSLKHLIDRLPPQVVLDHIAAGGEIDVDVDDYCPDELAGHCVINGSIYDFFGGWVNYDEPDHELTAQDYLNNFTHGRWA